VPVLILAETIEAFVVDVLYAFSELTNNELMLVLAKTAELATNELILATVPLIIGAVNVLADKLLTVAMFVLRIGAVIVLAERELAKAVAKFAVFPERLLILLELIDPFVNVRTSPTIVLNDAFLAMRVLTDSV
jgi:hypothetical protein